MTLCASVLMCHAPIVIPEVAGARASACAASTESMMKAAHHLASSSPDVLVCLSPHTPRRRHQFGVVCKGLDGHMARFGAPHVAVSFQGDERAAALIETHAGAHACRLDIDVLDHGAAVPLWFVQQAGFSQKVVLLALPAMVKRQDCIAFGDALGRAAEESDERWAILASGDMSHCLEPGAPGGFHPDGARFDAAFVEALAGDHVREDLLALSMLRARAAEDVFDTTLIALYAAQLQKINAWLSYEGPFGVGYGVALLS